MPQNNILRAVTFAVCCVLLSPVAYWYMSEPMVAHVFYTADTGNGGDSRGDACRFPDFDPFHPYAMKYYKKWPTTSCPDGMPTVTYYNGDEVKVNHTKKSHAFGDQPLRCWFRHVTFQSKVDFVDGPWQGPFHDVIKVKGRPEFVEVKCLNSRDDIVSRMHHYITRNEERLASPLPKHKKSFQRDSMNVILLCIDSMARHLFTRAMPRTKKYLIETIGSLEMKMYNKVGGNTLPNLMAVATGYLPTEFKNWSKSVDFDILPFQWKNYKSAGYRTQYVTDRPDFDNFKVQPTDSFTTPMAVSIMQGKIAFNNNCFEDKMEVPLWLNLILEFARESLYTTGRFYSFGMMNRPTHDFPNQASAVDEHYYNFLKELFESGLLNNTVLVLYGDHGPRMSGYRRTFYGSIEERAPLMTMHVPKWFREKYPVHYNNLQYNTGRLTTNFDVHETVTNLLSLETGGSLVTEYNGVKADTTTKTAIKRSETGKQRAFSLFSKIPKDRTCADADIAPHFCMCNGGAPVVNVDIMTEIGNQVVRDINVLLEPKIDFCEKLSLKSVTSLHLLSGRVGRTAMYRIIFSTKPSGAIFEATVEHSVTLYFYRTILTRGVPSRLDFYRGQSDCVKEDKTLKTLCYCKDVAGKASK